MLTDFLGVAPWFVLGTWIGYFFGVHKEAKRWIEHARLAKSGKQGPKYASGFYYWVSQDDAPCPKCDPCPSFDPNDMRH